MANDSITYNGGRWHSEDGIIRPVSDQPEPAKEVILAAKKSGMRKKNNTWQDASAVTTINDPGMPARDTLQIQIIPDSLTTSKHYGIVLVRPKEAETPVAAGNADKGMSWVYLALAILFCAVALKFRNNPRYISALLSDLTEVRTRNNAFDNTVRETMFLFLLNLMWIACAGIFLWQTIRYTCVYLPPEYSLGIPDRPAPGIGLCCGVAAIYQLLMMLAYYVVGVVFSDSARAILWVKGSAASQGLEVLPLFPLALLSLFYPQWLAVLLIIAACVFVIGKIIFIFKGFRIFFTHISSWLLFLYYLCSLEIVPLILCYASALIICSKVL